MNRRWVRVTLSLLITLTAYQIYAVVAVPLIEPQPDLESLGQQSLGQPADQRLQERLEELSRFFPGRSHLIKNAKMLEIDQVTLLFQDYWNLGDGRVLVRPCLLIFDSRKQSLQKWPPSLPNVLILEALEGAIFQFDRPLELRTAKIGRFIAGQLLGNVVLRGEETGPVRRDFRLTTREITLTEHRVWTNHPVELSWGRHRARGSGLELVFKGRTPLSPGGSAEGPMNIERFLLRHVDRLHLDLVALRATGEPAEGPGPEGTSSRDSNDDALDVVCQGPLIFVPERKTLTLEDRVEVARVQKGNPTLRIRCQQLIVTFREAEAAAVTPPGLASEQRAVASRQPQPGRGTARWNLHLVRAVGQPVRISFPGWRGELEGEDLRYDAITGAMSLEGSRGISGKRDKDAFEAQAAQCQVDRQGNLQALVASGPGKILLAPNKQAEEWRIFWGTTLSIKAENQQRVLFLDGGVTIEANPVGSLRAGQLWCWLDTAEQASQLDFTALRLRRFVAQSGVEITSPQLRARTERLESWVKWETSPEEAGASSQGPLNQTPPLPFSKTQDRSSPRAGQIVLQAGLLRAEFAMGNTGSPELSAVAADGNVIADEVVLVADFQPIHLRGDHLEVTQLTQPATVFALTGNPAFLAGRGVALTGYQIFFDRGRHLLSVAGTGRLEVQGGAASMSSIPSGEPLEIQWTQGMDLAGPTLSFHGDVQLTSGPRRIRAEALHLELEQPGELSPPLNIPAHQVRSARATGNVRAENLELSPDGRLLAKDVLKVAEIHVDLRTGMILAPGSGRFITIREASTVKGTLSGLQASRNNGQTPDSSPNRAAPAGMVSSVNDGSLPQLESSHSAQTGELVMLDISFHQALEGNFLQRQIGCRGRVKARYGKVGAWNVEQLSDDPAQLGSEGMLLTCHEITAFQMTSPGESKAHLELVAQGNVTVEGQSHTARARRLSLDESKSLLVLEGDGDLPAELYRQEYRGGPVQKTTARRIYYWYGTKTVKVDDARSLEISRTPELPMGW